MLTIRHTGMPSRAAVGVIVAVFAACTLSTSLDDLSSGSASSAAAGGASSAGSGGVAGSAGGAAPAGSGGTASTGGATSSSQATGGATNTCPPNGTSTIADDFNDGVIDARWMQYIGPGMNLRETQGTLFIDFGPATGATFADIRSVSPYDLTGCYAFVHADALPVGAADVYAALALYLTGVDTSLLEIVKYGDNMRFDYYKNGVMMQLKLRPFDATNDAWWRIREKSGTIYWETSPDGVTYTIGASLAPLPFAITALDVSLIAGTNVALTTPPSSARFDDLNVSP